jgi:hypothetical protein
MLLKDNDYIDLGYLTIGFVYYWRGKSFSNDNKRPDIELQVSKLACTYEYTVKDAVMQRTGAFNISYPNKVVLSNVYKEKTYEMSIVIHLGLSKSHLVADQIKEYYGKKYFMLQNNKPFKFEFSIPKEAIRIQVQNDAEAYYEVKPNIVDIRWTNDKPSILTSNLDVNNVTFVQKIINTNFDYNTSLGSRSIILPNTTSDTTTCNAEIYSFTTGSTKTMFAICTDGIVIKNTATNYITAQIVESDNKFYPIIKINGAAPNAETSTNIIYSK